MWNAATNGRLRVASMRVPYNTLQLPTTLKAAGLEGHHESLSRGVHDGEKNTRQHHGDGRPESALK